MRENVIIFHQNDPHTQFIWKKRGMNINFQVKATCPVSVWWRICISHISEFLIMKIPQSMLNVNAFKMRDLPNCPKRGNWEQRNTDSCFRFYSLSTQDFVLYVCCFRLEMFLFVVCIKILTYKYSRGKRPVSDFMCTIWIGKHLTFISVS